MSFLLPFRRAPMAAALTALALACPGAAAQAAAPLAPPYPPPYLLTDIGQGNGAKVVRALLKKQGIAPDMKEMATAADLKGAKTLLVGFGASTKGLGAAGLDAEQEIKRAKELLDAARAAKVPVVAIHLGGTSRRGELSDRFNALVMDSADHAVVWKEGDGDGFFTKKAADRKITLKTVEQKNDAGEALKAILSPGTGAAEAADTATSAAK